jgi:hypothetical protein
LFCIGVTQKLQKELKTDLMAYEDNMTEMTNVWHMNLFKVGRIKCIALMHDVTLYNMVLIGVKAKDFKNIKQVLQENLYQNLVEEGFDQQLIETFLDNGKEIMFTKTHSRSTLGCLKELISYVQYVYPTEKELLSLDPIKLNQDNNRFIFMKIKGYPISEMKEYLESLR